MGHGSVAPDGDPACEHCASRTVAAEVAVTLWLGAELKVVEGVPARVCEGCQARYFDAAVEAKLASLMASGAHERGAVRQMLVPVFAYADIKDFSAPAADENGDPRRRDDGE